MENIDELTSVSRAAYITKFRLMDARLGKWLAVDPKAKARPWESTYMMMGDNPIKMVDPDGDKWMDKATKTRAKEMKKAFKGVIKNNNSTTADKSEAKKALKELKDLKRSDELVRITVDPTAGGAYFGMTVDANNNNILEVVVPATPAGSNPGSPSPDGYLQRSMAHELKHAHQYIKGKISFSPNTFATTINGQPVRMRGVGSLYDKEDEVEAMRRGYVFDKTFWRFGSAPNRITDNSFIVRGIYLTQPMIQLSENTQMGKINRSRANSGAFIANGGLTAPQNQMTFHNYQQTLPVANREIYIHQR